MVGKMSGGIPKNLNNSLSHCCECKFINIVRLALVTSVTCAPPWQPPVRFCMWWWCQVMSQTAYHTWTNFKGCNYWGFCNQLAIKETIILLKFYWQNYWLKSRLATCEMATGYAWHLYARDDGMFQLYQQLLKQSWKWLPDLSPHQLRQRLRLTTTLSIYSVWPQQCIVTFPGSNLDRVYPDKHFWLKVTKSNVTCATHLASNAPHKIYEFLKAR